LTARGRQAALSCSGTTENLWRNLDSLPPGLEGTKPLERTHYSRSRFKRDLQSLTQSPSQRGDCFPTGSLSPLRGAPSRTWDRQAGMRRHPSTAVCTVAALTCASRRTSGRCGAHLYLPLAPACRRCSRHERCGTLDCPSTCACVKVQAGQAGAGSAGRVAAPQKTGRMSQRHLR
jgi:hypothetical protein